jgi:PAS domain-containing protein
MTTPSTDMPALPPASARAELGIIREWAAHITVPVFLVDPEGTLLFYNEPAEPLLGRRYDDAGQIRASQLAGIFTTTTLEGDPIPSDELPLSIALSARRPAHGLVRIVALDQEPRLLEVTAFPLLRRDGAFLGAVALFWARGARDGVDGVPAAAAL